MSVPIKGYKYTTVCYYCGEKHSRVVKKKGKSRFNLYAYCSADCKNRAEERLVSLKGIIGCPRKDKKIWVNPKEAWHEVYRMRRAEKEPNGRILGVYICVCGCYHIGTRWYVRKVIK